VPVKGSFKAGHSYPFSPLRNCVVGEVTDSSRDILVGIVNSLRMRISRVFPVYISIPPLPRFLVWILFSSRCRQWNCQGFTCEHIPETSFMFTDASFAGNLIDGIWIAQSPHYGKGLGELTLSEDGRAV
jgi:hypothetical protein